MDHRILLDDGSVKHLHELCTQDLNKNGEVLQYIGTVADVTQRVQAERNCDAVKLSRAEAQAAEPHRQLWMESNDRRTPLVHETIQSSITGGKFKPTLDLAFERVHPDDLASGPEALGGKER